MNKKNRGFTNLIIISAIAATFLATAITEKLAQYNKKENPNSNEQIKEQKKNGFLLTDTWYYKFQDSAECGSENVLLTNSLTGENFYIFDEKESYGDKSCLWRYFKFDKEKQIIYFLRTYEFCSGEYYGFNLKTKKLSLLDSKSTPEEMEKRMTLNDYCFNSFFANFETKSEDPNQYPVKK